MSLNIRLATPPDIPAIQDLEKQSDTAAHWGEDIYRSFFMDNGVERIVLVADHNGSLSGFVVVRAVEDEWELENLVVRPDFRRRGIGSALIHNLAERACQSHVQQILLEVRESNAPAHALYAKTGFVECGRRSRYYQEPEEDAICYRLSVPRRSHGC